MDNSPFIIPSGDGFKVFKRIGSSNYMFGYYQTEEEAAKIVAKVAACKTQADALALYAQLRDLQKSRIPAPGIYKTSDDVWYAKIKFLDDYFLVARCANEVEANLAYETALALKTVADVMNFRKANKINKDGRFRSDKNFQNPNNHKDYLLWLSSEELAPREPKDSKATTDSNKGHNAYFANQKQDVNLQSEIADFRASITPETTALFELLAQQEQDCIDALKNIRSRITKFKHAILLLNEVAAK
jgi:hypothetical protein